MTEAMIPQGTTAHWHVRRAMSMRGLWHIQDLRPLLAEQGVELSAAQVHRFVSTLPKRINMRAFVATCRALECSPDDLLEFRKPGAPPRSPELPPRS